MADFFSSLKNIKVNETKESDGFNIEDFFPTEDVINENARYSHADETFFPQLNTADAGSFQELTTDTNNKVTQIQELMKHKQDAQITEVVLPQESFSF